MERTPLATLLGRLPQIMRARYAGGNDSLWVTLFNQVLNDIETTMRAPELMATVVVPYQHLGLTNPIPVGLSRVMDARQSDGTPVRIAENGTSWVVMDDGLPAESDIIASKSVFGTPVSYANRLWTSASDPTAAVAADAGNGIVLTSGESINASHVATWIAPAVMHLGAYLMIAFPGEPGEFRDVGSVADANVHILRTFLAVDGVRQLERAVTAASRSPLSPRWDYVLVDGLEALGEEMTKRSSSEAQAARNKYEAKKQEMGGWASSYRPSMAKPRLSPLNLPRRR